MNRERILAIEDDEGVCRLLRHCLAREDFDLQIVASGRDGLIATREMELDLVLLDLGLPDIDGLEICRRLKSDPETRHLPVVILTGKGEESDVVSGLEMGADDYIIKPFRPRILNARIRAVLRRRQDISSPQATSENLNIGRLAIFPKRETVTLGSEVFELAPPEFNFVHALAQILTAPAYNPLPDLSIGQEGMALYSKNRLDRILPIFEELLNVSAHQNPLLFKFAGLALLNSDVTRAADLLRQSARLFEQINNPAAELSVAAHLILCHVFLDGNIDEAVVLFNKAEQLAHQNFDLLSVFSRISTAQAMAVGHALLCSNFSRAYEYLSIAEALAEDRGIEGFRVINLLIHAYEAYMSADTAKLSKIIDDTLPLQNHPQINTIYKALLKMPQLVYIGLTGEFDYFHSVEQGMRDEFDANLPPTSFPSCLLTVLQAQVAQTEGDHDTVLALHSSILNNRLHQPIMTGMVALSAALNNQPATAMAAITARLSFEQPVSFVNMQGSLYCIRALLALDQTADAAKLAEKIQTQLDSSGSKLIEIQVLALSLLFHRDRPWTSHRLASLQGLMGELKTTGIRHLRCLTRDDLRFLLFSAISQNIDRPFASDLCRSLLQVGWNRDWEPVPLLHFKTLGGLQISCAEQSLLSIEGFSRNQRECLALLVAAPKNRIDQEEMQLTFWPDSSPEKARANLDTMLSRLRKTVEAQIKPLSTKNYLKLQKGVVSLDHCTFDTEELLAGLSKGRNFLFNREFWRAEVTLSHAFSLWAGEFIPGACVTNQTAEFAEQIHHSCIQATLFWGEMLNDLGQTARSIRLLNKALSLDRCNEDVVSALYRSYMRSKNLLKAAQLLKQFEEGLKKEGIVAAEVARQLSRIRSNSSHR